MKKINAEVHPVRMGAMNQDKIIAINPLYGGKEPLSFLAHTTALGPSHTKANPMIPPTASPGTT